MTATRRAATIRTLLDVPWLFLSGLAVVAVAGSVGFTSWGWVFLAVWLASGPLSLLRPVENAGVASSRGLRRPTVREGQRLRPAWDAVTLAAGVDPSDYEVWIEPSQRINAFAAAGHTVAVTERAVAVLPAAQLQAVLAHEIGHHLGGHTSMALLRYWYSLPAHYGLTFASYLTMAARAALESGSRTMTAVVGAVIVGIVGVAFVTAPIAGGILVVVLILPFLSLWLGRRSEHEADLMAAQIGYRAALVEYLRSSPRPPSSGSAWRTRLTASHPSNSERIRFLEDQDSSSRGGHEDLGEA